MSNARELSDLVSAAPSTDASFDGGTLYIDRTNNRVGIGTSSPATALDVNGNIVIADSGTIGSASATSAITISAAGVSTISSLVATTADINGGTIDGVTLGTNSAVTEAQVDNINIDGNTISSTDTDGNITLSPDGSGKVTIGGAGIQKGVSSATLSIWGGGTYRGGQIDLVGGAAAADAGSILFRTGTGAGSTAQPIAMTIDSSGRVGIGVTPEYPLDISSNSTQIRIKDSDTATASGPTAGIRFEGSDGTHGALGTFGSTDFRVFSDGDLVFAAGGTLAADEKMRINSSGKVGIGTSSPLGNVTIANAAGTNAPTSVTAANAYLQLGSKDFGPSNNGKFMIGFGYTNATNTNSPAYIGFEEVSTTGATYGDLTFYTRSTYTDTAPTERMRIDSDGDVQLTGSLTAGTIGNNVVFPSGSVVGVYHASSTATVTGLNNTQEIALNFTFKYANSNFIAIGQCPFAVTTNVNSALGITLNAKTNATIPSTGLSFQKIIGTTHSEPYTYTFMAKGTVTSTSVVLRFYAQHQVYTTGTCAYSMGLTTPQFGAKMTVYEIKA